MQLASIRSPPPSSPRRRNQNTEPIDLIYNNYSKSNVQLTYHLAVVSMRSSWYDTVKENLAARLLTRCSRFQTLPIVYLMSLCMLFFNCFFWGSSSCLPEGSGGGNSLFRDITSRSLARLFTAGVLDSCLFLLYFFALAQPTITIIELR